MMAKSDVAPAEDKLSTSLSPPEKPKHQPEPPKQSEEIKMAAPEKPEKPAKQEEPAKNQINTKEESKATSLPERSE